LQHERNIPRRLSGRALERALKRWLMAALGQLVRPAGVPRAPDWSDGSKRILYLRHDRIGDMVLATGVLKAIACAQPKLIVDVLASAANAAALAGNPYVGSVIILDKKRPWTYLRTLLHIRRAAYDAVVDSMVLSASLTATLLMCFSGAPHRIGIAGRGNQRILTLSVPPLANATHYIDRSAAVLAAFGEAPRTPGTWHPELFLKSEELRAGEAHWSSADALVSSSSPGQRLRLMVNVSAGKSPKYWPVERFIAMLHVVRTAFPNLSVLVVGLPADLARMAQLAREANVRVAYTPQLRQMMAVVAASDLVFTADTAVTHVASAFRKPALVMFVGDGSDLYGPYRGRGTVIACRGRSLESLQVEPVTRALMQLIAAEREHHLPSKSGAVAPGRSAGRIPCGSGRIPLVARAFRTPRHRAEPV
jgi:ADP-heptose:LPS heptosyltransferase